MKTATLLITASGSPQLRHVIATTEATSPAGC
jgi:hypothetical protein